MDRQAFGMALLAARACRYVRALWTFVADSAFCVAPLLRLTAACAAQCAWFARRVTYRPFCLLPCRHHRDSAGISILVIWTRFRIFGSAALWRPACDNHLFHITTTGTNN